MATAKVAIVLYGFLRCFKMTHLSLMENIVNHLNADVYISCPNSFYVLKNEECSALSIYYGKDNLEFVDINFLSYIFKNSLKKSEIFVHEANVYKDIVRTNRIPEVSSWNQPAYRIISMFTNISRSIKLLQESNVKYDTVILTRPDNKYYSKFKIENVDLSRINFPDHGRFSLDGSKQRNLMQCGGLNCTFNDQMIVGTQENISSFIDLPQKVIEYVHNGVILNQETMLAKHLLEKKIKFGSSDLINYNTISHALIRENKWY